jgi:hypothetical protein
MPVTLANNGLITGGLLGPLLITGGLASGTPTPTPTPPPPTPPNEDTLDRHHPATYTLSSTPVLISAARRGRTLFVQLESGSNAYVGGVSVSSSQGIPLPASGSLPFIDSVTSAAWYAVATSGSPVINVDEIY